MTVYEVRCETARQAVRAYNAIEKALGRSRFCLADGMRLHSYKDELRIVRMCNVRLREAKDYCGNHAYACAIANPGRAGRPHRHYKFLEGADWVGFNDMINDVLDRLRFSALVRSTLVTVRVGCKRCVEYTADRNFGGEWKRCGIYEDHCGLRAPPSRFPPGTPGIPTWRVA